LQGSKATTISLFQYPGASKIIKKVAKLQQRSQAAQQSSSEAAEQHSNQVPSHQLRSHAGAKMPRHQDFFPGTRHFAHFPGIPLLAGPPKMSHKSTTLAPRYRDGQISQ
jgi:hypothetical protein